MTRFYKEDYDGLCLTETQLEAFQALMALLQTLTAILERSLLKGEYFFQKTVDLGGKYLACGCSVC